MNSLCTLHSAKPGTVFFDASKQGGANERSLLFCNPVETLQVFSTSDIPSLLLELDNCVDKGYYVAGFMDYEAGYAFEKWPAYKKEDAPLAWFGVYESCQFLEPNLLATALATQPDTPFSMSAPAFSLTREQYTERIQRIKEHIRNGDVYQINFTGSLSFTYEGDPFYLYRLLRTRQSVSYGALITYDQGHILSFSPELFIDIEGRNVTTRPMKGTIGRGASSEEDKDLGNWLVNDAKNRAENVMIVDLLRNDLSRVCEVGTVHVPHLYSLETYETLFQMTSTVMGTLKPDVSSLSLFEALYPGGSITGAPKLRAMEIIRDLEDQPRGIYCGTMGYRSPDHRSVFNIAIRTLDLRDGVGRMGIGSGIVWDSQPDLEYDECILKGQFLQLDHKNPHGA